MIVIGVLIGVVALVVLIGLSFEKAERKGKEKEAAERADMALNYHVDKEYTDEGELTITCEFCCGNCADRYEGYHCRKCNKARKSIGKKYTEWQSDILLVPPTATPGTCQECDLGMFPDKLRTPVDYGRQCENDGECHKWAPNISHRHFSERQARFEFGGVARGHKCPHFTKTKGVE